MAYAVCDTEHKTFFDKMKHFPPVINGRINVIEFLEASSSLVALIELNGKVFSPVKYDVLGNIEKIKRCYRYNDESCLLELMLKEGKKNTTGADAVLWLNRALLFMEILINELIASIQTKQYNESMKRIITVAYEGSIRKYHNWVTQQIFSLICKMCGTLPQYLKSLGVNIENGDEMKALETTLTTYNIRQHLIRCKIDDFFNEHCFFEDTNDDATKKAIYYQLNVNARSILPLTSSNIQKICLSQENRLSKVIRPRSCLSHSFKYKGNVANL